VRQLEPLVAVVLLGLGVAAAALVAPGHAQERRRATHRATERLTLVVEVLDRDPRPVIPCGVMGAQPRDVTARVLSVQEGHFEGDRVLLSWPLCEFTRVAPGNRFRIHIRRWADAPGDPSRTRYRVREFTAVAPGAPVPAGAAAATAH